MHVCVFERERERESKVNFHIISLNLKPFCSFSEPPVVRCTPGNPTSHRMQRKKAFFGRKVFPKKLFSIIQYCCSYNSRVAYMYRYTANSFERSTMIIFSIQPLPIHPAIHYYVQKCHRYVQLCIQNHKEYSQHGFTIVCGECVCTRDS